MRRSTPRPGNNAAVLLGGLGLLGALIVTVPTRSPALGSGFPVAAKPTVSALVTRERALPPEQDPKDLRSKPFENVVSYIPPQCYTKTVDAQGRVHNPCFTCHSGGREPNYAADAELQLAFDFPEPALQNPWHNLFVDRGPAVRDTTDAAALSYVRTSNYFEPDGKLRLAERLAHVPEQWDFDANGRFEGYVPDAYFSFDEQGFDHDPSGVESGWRVYGPRRSSDPKRLELT